MELLVIDHLSRMPLTTCFHINTVLAYLTLVDIKTCSGGVCACFDDKIINHFRQKLAFNCIEEK